mgnify:FL=1
MTDEGRRGRTEEGVAEGCPCYAAGPLAARRGGKGEGMGDGENEGENRHEPAPGFQAGAGVEQPVLETLSLDVELGCRGITDHVGLPIPLPFETCVNVPDSPNHLASCVASAQRTRPGSMSSIPW